MDMFDLYLAVVWLARILVGLFLNLGDYNPKTTPHFNSAYDYIIVGAGTAGSVVAARLSEDPCVRVLLLEAGAKAIDLTRVPATTLLAQFTENDWQYYSVPQRHASTGLNGRKIYIPRGKALGGTSLLNGMMYVRGNKRDYDRWEEIGCKGWSWKDVFPYFLKLENNTNKEFVANGYHSTGGPVTIQDLQYTSTLIKTFASAGIELGYDYGDINAAKQTGFYKIQGNTENGRRDSMSTAYLIPAEDRPNLHIVDEALVLKILINGNKVAYGVQFEKNGRKYEVRADKEVVVSGGAINSPQILMLSGIGHRSHLEELGIPVIADLPVGDNYQDHPGYLLLNFEAPGAKEAGSLNKNIYDFNKNGTGPLTSIAGVEGIAFVNSRFNDPFLDWPDIELFMLSSSVADDMGITTGPIFNLPFKVVQQVYLPYFGKETFSFFPVILREKSRGILRLASKDPKDYPLIDPNFLQDKEDLEKIVDGARACVHLATKTKAFQEIGAKMFTTKLPGCEQFEINSTYYSDDYLRCAASKYTISVYHPSGTCRMGKPSDSTTVVDPQLRVKGIKNLRVVDASIMPYIVSGNTNTPIIMIAEKASDMIKKDNAYRNKC